MEEKGCWELSRMRVIREDRSQMDADVMAEMGFFFLSGLTSPSFGRAG
jgi:hypothetical protein